ncbi:hypothetical protein AKJ16_DCAP27289, partial [Drosera capensis]
DTRGTESFESPNSGWNQGREVLSRELLLFGQAGEYYFAGRGRVSECEERGGGGADGAEGLWVDIDSEEV